jgi:hypothetical protein
MRALDSHLGQRDVCIEADMWQRRQLPVVDEGRESDECIRAQSGDLIAVCIECVASAPT